MFPKTFLEKIEDKFVIQESIFVVHAVCVTTIMELDVQMGDALAEIGLTAIGQAARLTRGGGNFITLKQSTPKSSSFRSLPAYHSQAAGFVKSTMTRPGCQRLNCHGVPSDRLM